MSEEQDFTPKEHVVAYLDFLNMEKRIEEDNIIEDIYKIYERTALDFGVYLDKRIEKNSKSMFNIRIFSDNIIIFSEINKNLYGKNGVTKDDVIESFLSEIIIFCAYFQNRAACDGFLLRGGITYGNFFHNDVMVWGKALVDAYILEDKVAIYPRIIIDEKLHEVIFPEKYTRHCSSLLCKCEDGYYCVDFLSQTIYDVKDINGFAKHLFEKHPDVSDKKDQQKIKWFKGFLTRKLTSPNNW